MSQRMIGIIAAATTIKQFQKKDGTTSEQATLHVQEVTNNPYPQEIAVKVTGPNAQFAKMVGSNVEVEYVVRVFKFKGKDGEDMIGNDIYARNIKVADAAVVVAQPVYAQPQVAGYLPAPQPVAGYLPTAPQVAGYLPAPQPVLALPAPPQPAGYLPAPAAVNANDGDAPF